MFVRRFETRCWFLVLTLVASACGGSSPATGGGGNNGKGGAGVGLGGSAPGKGGAGAGAGGAQGTGGVPAGTGGHAGAGGGGTPANGGSHGTAGAGGMSPVTANPSMAKACTADTDCGAGLVCLKATDKLIGNQGGPANGYCTIKCVADADFTTCEAAGGICLNLAAAGAAAPVGYCMRNCTIGKTADTDPPKCQARPDLACTQLYDSNSNPAGAACVPLCAVDSDCPTGRKCDPQEGVCVDTVHTGDPMGAHCTGDPTTGASACAGSCLSLVDANDMPTVSFCSQRCVIGAPKGCNIAVGANMSLAGGAHGACVYQSDPTGDIGDVGFCTVECDTVNDCPDKTDPNPVCDTADFMADLGHGLCTWTM